MVQFIRRKNEVFYYYDDEDEADEVSVSLLHKTLRVSVPGAQYSPMFKKGVWDGYKKFYDGRQQKFGSGLLPKVLAAFKTKNITYQLELQEARFTVKRSELDPRLRPHQADSVLKFFKYDFGILKMPTRGGKTITAAEILKQITLRSKPVKGVKRPVVFIVDTIDLYDQTIDEFAKYYSIPREAVGVLEGDKPFAPQLYNVWKVQTLVALLGPVRKGKLAAVRRKKARDVVKFMSSVQALVVDEWQEYGSDKRQAVLHKFNRLLHFLVISATPYKSTDRLNKMILMSTGGGIFHTVLEADLVEAGYLTETAVGVIINEIPENEQGETYDQFFKRAIIRNKERNTLLVSLLRMLDVCGFKTLALFRSKEHGHAIAKETGFTFLSGDNDKVERSDTKHDFLGVKGGVLLASDIWKKGITLPEVQVLVNCNGGKEDSVIIQRAGRIKGAIEGKSRAFVIDIIDSDGNWMSDHGYRRVRVYEKSTKPQHTTVVYTTDPNWLPDLQAILKEWFM